MTLQNNKKKNNKNNNNNKNLKTQMNSVSLNSVFFVIENNLVLLVVRKVLSIFIKFLRNFNLQKSKLTFDCTN